MAPHPRTPISYYCSTCPSCFVLARDAKLDCFRLSATGLVSAATCMQELLPLKLSFRLTNQPPATVQPTTSAACVLPSAPSFSPRLRLSAIALSSSCSSPSSPCPRDGAMTARRSGSWRELRNEAPQRRASAERPPIDIFITTGARPQHADLVQLAARRRIVGTYHSSRSPRWRAPLTHVPSLVKVCMS